MTSFIIYPHLPVIDGSCLSVIVIWKVPTAGHDYPFENSHFWSSVFHDQ